MALAQETERFLYYSTVLGKSFRYWHVRPGSRLRLVVPRLLQADPTGWPACNDPWHWGWILDPPHSYTMGAQHWHPQSDALPDDPPLKPELFVATILPKGPLETQELTEGDEPVAFSAMLPRGMHKEYDPTLPDDYVNITPWRNQGMDTTALGPELSTRLSQALGHIVLHWASWVKQKDVHLFAPLPENGLLPANWLEASCYPLGVFPYCAGIPQKDGSPRGLQMVLSLPLGHLSSAFYAPKFLEPVNTG